MEQGTSTVWRKCSTCKKPLSFGSKHFVCSVSTCNSQRTGYVFCSVSCFEGHLPVARHRDAAAMEQTAPPAAGAVRAPARIMVQSTAVSPSLSNSQVRPEVLIIASRLKDYIQARSDFNTSGGVMEVLSDYVRILCDRAIDNARAEGRKTVLDRDFHFLKTLK